jgi:hypothetical protein
MSQTLFCEGLVCGSTGDAYAYGSAGSGSNITLAFQRFGTDGKLLQTKNTGLRLRIRKMVHDGASLFYFVGTFTGSIAAPFNTIHSSGDTDGVLGCMDESGEVKWVRSLGGEEKDELNGIAFSSGGDIVVTGMMAGNFYYNGSIVSQRAVKTLFLARVGYDGTLLDHQMIDFDHTQNSESRGNELVIAPNGDYFLLAYREGSAWVEENPSVPYSGYYVYRLSADFGILWSKMIVNGSCYYGNYAHGLAACGNNVTVSRYCSGKYGGDADLLLLDGSNGTELYERENPDGGYPGVASSGGILHFTANVEADDSPSQSNFPGYYVLISRDGLQNEHTYVKASHGIFQHIALNKTGLIVVTGHSSSLNDSIYLSGTGYKMRSFVFAYHLPGQENAVTGLSTTGADRSLRIFPNPAPGKFEIQFRSDIPVSDFLVYDAIGKKIDARVTRISGARYEVNLETVPAGVYLLTAISGDAVLSRKVVTVTQR